RHENGRNQSTADCTQTAEQSAGDQARPDPWEQEQDLAAQDHVDEEADVPCCQVLVQSGEPVQDPTENSGDVGAEDTDDGRPDESPPRSIDGPQRKPASETSSSGWLLHLSTSSQGLERYGSIPVPDRSLGLTTTPRPAGV